MSDEVTVIEVESTEVVVESPRETTVVETERVETRVDATDSTVVVESAEQPVIVEMTEAIEYRTIIQQGGGSPARIVWDPAGDLGVPDDVNTFAGFAEAFAAFMQLPPGSDFLIASSGTVPPNPADLNGVWDFQNRARYFGGATAARTPLAVADGALVRNATRVVRLSFNLPASAETRPVFDYTGGRVVTLEDCTVLAIFVTNRPLFLDANDGVNELNIRDTLAFSFLAAPLVVNDDTAALTTRIEGATSGLSALDFSGSGGFTFFYLGSSVQTPDAVSANPGDFPLVSGPVGVNRDIAVSAFANDSGYLTGAEWGTLVQTWSTMPTIQPYSGGGGRVFRYDYPGPTTLYRFVPAPYDASLDAFYTTFVDPTLSGVVAVRATAPNL